MREIKTQIAINAGAEKVWEILMDFAAYPDWNPFIKSISGKPERGKQIQVKIHPPGGKAMSFKPEILGCEPHKEFRWRGKFLIKGLFDGEHYFQLESKSPKRTLLIHGEHFSGILLPLLKGTLGQAENGFKAMNQALKSRCE